MGWIKFNGWIVLKESNVLKGYGEHVTWTFSRQYLKIKNKIIFVISKNYTFSSKY